MLPSSLLSPEFDPMGTAIIEYVRKGRSCGKLRVQSSLFDDDEIPVAHLFRSYAQMPELEQRALGMVRGRTLDVGAGAGCHALYLQERGVEVKAIDISSLSCEAMLHRGIRDVQCVNLFDPALVGVYDTILMLMNGTGIVGRLGNLPEFFQRVRQLLAPGGQLLIDSSDLKYLYENEDGTYDLDLASDYYGEIDYRMVYRRVKGELFYWLYVDYLTLGKYASEAGLLCELMFQGDHYDYLARITVK